MPFSSRTVGPLAAVLTIAIWTFFIIVSRASASHSLLPLDIAFLRSIGASCVLMPWGFWLRRHDTVRSGSLFGLSPLPLGVTVQVSLFGSVFYAMLAYNGFFYAPAAHASVLMPGSLPLWTALLTWLTLHEQVPRQRLVGLSCIVLGDLCVGGASLLHAFDGGDIWKGDLLFVGGSMSWAIYTVLVRRHALKPVEATMAITVFALLTFVPLYGAAAWLGWLPSHLGSAPWSEIVFQTAYQGLFSVVISGITFNLMIRCYGPVRSTMMTALVPGLSALGAALLLGEPLTAALIVGLALVTAGILFGVRRA